jgi:hypothetical protein
MIILDIDGCVLDNRRLPSYKEWLAAIPTLEPNQPLIDMMTPNLANVMFVTGRGEEVRQLTMDWFHVHWPEAIERSMGFRFRPANSYLPSEVVKLQILKDLEKAGYPKPTIAIDDVKANIEMFQSMGIITMHHLLPGAVYRDIHPTPSEFKEFVLKEEIGEL